MWQSRIIGYVIVVPALAFIFYSVGWSVLVGAFVRVIVAPFLNRMAEEWDGGFDRAMLADRSKALSRVQWRIHEIEDWTH